MVTKTAPPQSSNNNSSPNRLRTIIIGFVLFSIASLVGIFALAVVTAAGGNFATTVQVARNLLIILVALEMLLAWAAFTLMLVQVARFANLINSELRPILSASSETVNVVRGTVTFVSQNVTEPIVQINELVAGARQALRVVSDVNYLRDILTTAIDISQATPNTSQTDDAETSSA